jgi:hypothetical protein
MADLSGAQRAALAAERPAQQKVEGEIGVFVFAFSQLELTIQYVLGSALRLEGERSSRPSRGRTTLQCYARSRTPPRREAGLGQSLHDRINQLFRDCLGLNTDRVRVAHGHWFADLDGGGASVFSRDSLTVKMHFAEPGSLPTLTERANDLMNRVVELLIKGPADTGRPQRRSGG